jgi:hypothetical protein
MSYIIPEVFYGPEPSLVFGRLTTEWFVDTLGYVPELETEAAAPTVEDRFSSDKNRRKPWIAYLRFRSYEDEQRFNYYLPKTMMVVFAKTV